MISDLINFAKRKPALMGHVLFLMAASVTLGGAWYSQIFGGLFPCPLCLEQREPWYIGTVISALAIGLPLVVASLAAWRLWALLPNMGLLLWGAYTAAYHVGVEHQWWGSACTGPDGGSGPLTIEQMNAAMEADISVPCDAIQWELFGITMAGYNLMISLGLCAILACLFVTGWRNRAQQAQMGD